MSETASSGHFPGPLKWVTGWQHFPPKKSDSICKRVGFGQWQLPNVSCKWSKHLPMEGGIQFHCCFVLEMESTLNLADEIFGFWIDLKHFRYYKIDWTDNWRSITPNTFEIEVPHANKIVPAAVSSLTLAVWLCWLDEMAWLAPGSARESTDGLARHGMMNIVDRQKHANSTKHRIIVMADSALVVFPAPMRIGAASNQVSYNNTIITYVRNVTQFVRNGCMWQI